MSVVYVTSPTGVQSNHSEAELRSLWSQNRIEPGSLIWNEEAQEWRPMEEYFQPVMNTNPYQANTATFDPRSALSTFEENPPTGPYSLRKNLGLLTTLVVIGFSISALAVIAMLVGDLGQLSLLSREYTVEEGEFNDGVQGLLGLAYLIVYFPSIVIYYFWLHRVSSNCHGFGANQMTFTPGWTVGYHFIPIMNLFKPFHAMQEIWKVSTDPATWQTMPNSSLVNFWWAAWIITQIGGQAVSRMSSKADTIEELTFLTYASIASNIVAIVFFIIAIMLVRTLYAKQQQLVDSSQQAIR